MSVEGAGRRQVRIALLLFGLALGVYGVLSPPGYDGYENETAAVAEGIARGEGARMPLDTQLIEVDPENRSGRTGILQPLLMVPFYGAGAALDSVDSGQDEYTFRAFLLLIYGAFVTALCVALLFLLVRALGPGEGWAVLIALLFAFASIALPYAGIGMEPTGTLAVLASFLTAAYAARSDSVWLWALTGAALGLAASTRPSNALPALGALVLLLPRLRRAEPTARRRLLGALAFPLLVGAAVYIAYSADRFDRPITGAYGSPDYELGSVPSALVGLYLSPGKGLAWYSPLVILGALGLAAMWRRERIAAIALLTGLALGTLPYLIGFWSDETLGPRYLVPVAWMLLVPIAWWATTRRRQVVLAAVAAVAIWVQLTGALINYRTVGAVVGSGNLTGVHVYGQIFDIPDDQIPYGDDAVRWIPELSPLRINSAALISVGARNVGLSELQLRYDPFRGREGSADLSVVPVDVWWNGGAPASPDIPRPSQLWLIPFLLLAAGSAARLWQVRAGRPRPPGSEPATSA